MYSRSLGFIALGALGGAFFALFPIPLPYLLGALAINALAVALLPARFIAGYAFPDSIRMPFISVIGLLIGSQIHVERIADWPSLGALMIAVTLFTPLAHWLNYQLLRGVGRYSPVTAFYAGAPGGLLEALTLGQQAGADIALLTAQHFLRIILVTTMVPLAMSLWAGYPVGSAAGLDKPVSGGTSPLWILLAVGVAGAYLGRILRLPAAPMIGPMLLGGALTASGYIELALPGWLVIVAQVIIGTSLGLQFNGISAATMRRGLGMSVLSVAMMLTLGAGLTLILTKVSSIPGSAALLSLAPGGVTEMALVALSIAADPALVTLAHVYRIALTVMFLAAAPRLLSPRPSRPD